MGSLISVFSIIVFVMLFSSIFGGLFRGKKRQNQRRRNLMTEDSLRQFFKKIREEKATEFSNDYKVKGYDVKFNLLEYPFNISLKRFGEYLDKHSENTFANMQQIRDQILTNTVQFEGVFEKAESLFLNELNRMLTGIPIEGDWIDIIGNAYKELYGSFLNQALDLLGNEIYVIFLNDLYNPEANKKILKLASQNEYINAKVAKLTNNLNGFVVVLIDKVIKQLNQFFYNRKAGYSQGYQQYEQNTNYDQEQQNESLVKHAYDVFGLSESASNDEIKKRYRELAKKYHPDTSKEKNAKEKMLEINVAYEEIKKTRDMK